MSREIDERIVEMRFDNEQFEKNIHTSMSSLDKLERSLKFTEATKGFENLESASNKVNMSGLSNAVETVSVKFSALQVMAVTALTNITNSAVNAGRRIVSALTVDPVKTGFSEYETQINAIQTILANTESKGTTLKDVNGALDELNAYADKTIYNFTEMTRNIGTFTAAGTDLDTSVKAIKGIANLAAVSGSTSQQASVAMYQLSQALSSGTVKLMDWNSVVNAGMGGQVFQDALKETARVHGIEIDAMIDKEGSFRETLKDGWLSSEILTETLEKFTLATEGVTEAEIEKNREMLKSKGYTEERIDAIFKMGNTATNAATKVKTFTQLFDTLKEAAQSGWTQTWEIIVGDFEEAKKLLTSVSDTIGAMIGSSAEARNEMLKGWKDLGGREVLVEAIRNAFEGILNIIKPIKDAFGEIFPATTAKQLLTLTKGLETFTGKFKDLFKEGSETGDKLKRTFKGVFALLDIGVQLVKAIAGGFVKLMGVVAPVGGDLLGFTAAVGDAIVKFRDFLKSSNVFNKAIMVIASVIGKVFASVKHFVANVATALKGFATIDTSGVDKFVDKIKERFAPFTALGEGIINLFKAIGNFIKKISPVFFGFAKAIGTAIGTFGENINEAVADAKFDEVVDILNSFLTGGLILSIKKFINTLSDITKNAKGFIEGFRNIIDGVADTFVALQTKLKADALLSIASAIALLAAALVVLSLIDSEKLKSALAVMTVMFVDLTASLVAVMKYGGGKKLKDLIAFKSAVSAMTTIATAVLILAIAMSTVAKLDAAGIAKGLTAIGSLTVMMVGTILILSKYTGKKMTKGLGSLITMAIAIRILAGAVEKLGALDMKSIGKGLLGVGVLLAEVMLFMKLAQKNKMNASKGLGLVLLAAAINILANAVKKFSEIKGEDLIKGLAAVAVVLAELTIFTKLTGNAKKVTSTAIGLTILGAAMVIFAKAVSDMGKMSWEEIAKGLTAMAGALTIVTLALNFLPKGMLSKGTGLVLIASALTILGVALSKMGGMSWAEVAKALVTLASSLTIIAVAMHFMTSAIPGALAMLILAPAIGVLTLALKGLGSMNWEEIAKSLTMLAGVFVVVGLAGLVLAPIVPTILGLSGAIVLLGVGCLAVGAGILAFAAGISALGVSLATASVSIVATVASLLGLIPLVLTKVGEGIIALCNTIGGGAEAILNMIVRVLTAVLQALTKCIPPLIECLKVLVDELLAFLKEYTPKFIDSGINIILALLKGVANSIGKIIQAAVDIVVAFLRGVGQEAPRIADAGFKMMINFIDGLTAAINGNSEELRRSFRDLGDALIDGLVKGISDGAKFVKEKIIELCKSAWQSVKDFFGIKSPSREAIKVGKFIDQGLGIGLEKYSDITSDSATEMGKTTMGALKKALSNVSDVIDSDMDMSPTIRPVIDLTDVKSGERQLSNMLGKSRTITVNSANVKTAAISNGMNTDTNTQSGTSKQGTSISFTQNNYSPKALSKIDIYRQTKNQFSAMKGALVGR